MSTSPFHSEPSPLFANVKYSLANILETVRPGRFFVTYKTQLPNKARFWVRFFHDVENKNNEFVVLTDYKLNDKAVLKTKFTSDHIVSTALSYFLTPSFKITTTNEVHITRRSPNPGTHRMGLHLNFNL